MLTIGISINTLSTAVIITRSEATKPKFTAHISSVYDKTLEILPHEAMNRHNNSEAVARFFGIARPLIDGEVTLVTGMELSAKSND